MSKALNKVYNGKFRHISLRHVYLRQMLRDGALAVVHLRTYNNLVNPLTKPLPRDLVNTMSLGMGLKPFV